MRESAGYTENHSRRIEKECWTWSES